MFLEGYIPGGFMGQVHDDLFDVPHSLICLKSDLELDFGMCFYDGLKQEKLIVRAAYPNTWRAVDTAWSPWFLEKLW